MKWLRKLWVECDPAKGIMDGSIPPAPPPLEYKFEITTSGYDTGYDKYQWQFQQAQQNITQYKGLNGNIPGLTPAAQYQQLMDMLMRGSSPAQASDPGVHTQEWADEQRRMFGIIEEHREAA